MEELNINNYIKENIRHKALICWFKRSSKDFFLATRAILYPTTEKNHPVVPGNNMKTTMATAITSASSSTASTTTTSTIASTTTTLSDPTWPRGRRWWGAWRHCQPSYQRWLVLWRWADTWEKTDRPDCTRTSCSWRWKSRHWYPPTRSNAREMSLRKRRFALIWFVKICMKITTTTTIW